MASDMLQRQASYGFGWLVPWQPQDGVAIGIAGIGIATAGVTVAGAAGIGAGRTVCCIRQPQSAFGGGGDIGAAWQGHAASVRGQ